ncbi:peptidylprolyl isomerase [Aquabacterium sp.]|uniref:peptidylprolyl isomerase n=1 Tax=Aquabacterium sp. TaxID=1872578 RepID=UPI0035B0C198
MTDFSKHSLTQAASGVGHRLLSTLMLGLALLTAGQQPALAQGFRLDSTPTLGGGLGSPGSLSTQLSLPGAPSTADYIVAVVNQEPITHQDIEKRVSRIIATAAPGARLPNRDELRRQVLDALIDEKVQLGQAKTLGMDISDSELDAAVENIATQNQLSLSELRARMKQDGLDFDRYRSSLKEQMLLERVRAREVTSRIQISDEDIDAFYAGTNAAGVAYNLAHILIPVPEKASSAQIEALRVQAEDLRARAARGESFSELVKAYSGDPTTKAQGGVIGMRPATRLPDVFVDAVKDVKVGGIAPVVRSSAGFHVVKLVERENTAKATYTQQRARHILLRTSATLTSDQAKARMNEIRRQIVDGQASFAQMARQYSEDGSAMRGGDLGWASPGQFVPEFEQALSALQPGQVSQPVVSRFGVHLIQLIERREVALSDQQKREAARSVLREQRFDAAYDEWARELRAAAWVEMRDAP